MGNFRFYSILKLVLPCLSLHILARLTEFPSCVNNLYSFLGPRADILRPHGRPSFFLFVHFLICPWWPLVPNSILIPEVPPQPHPLSLVIIRYLTGSWLPLPDSSAKWLPGVGWASSENSPGLRLTASDIPLGSLITDMT